MKSFIRKFKKNKLVRFILYPIIKIKREIDFKKQNRIFKKYNIEALKKFKESLDSINVPFWLEWGTLLGAYREMDFISHDLDLDFGMYLKDYSEDLENVLTKNGFKKLYQYEFNGEQKGLEITFEYNGLHIDIFYFSKENEDVLFCHHFNTVDGLYLGEYIEAHGGLMAFKDTCPNFELKEFNFKGINLFIPDDTDLHLKIFYGEDYMIPKVTKGEMEEDYTYSQRVGIGKYKDFTKL